MHSYAPGNHGHAPAHHGHAPTNHARSLDLETIMHWYATVHYALTGSKSRALTCASSSCTSNASAPNVLDVYLLTLACTSSSWTWHALAHHGHTQSNHGSDSARHALNQLIMDNQLILQWICTTHHSLDIKQLIMHRTPTSSPRTSTILSCTGHITANHGQALSHYAVNMHNLIDHRRCNNSLCTWRPLAHHGPPPAHHALNMHHFNIYWTRRLIRHYQCCRPQCIGEAPTHHERNIRLIIIIWNTHELILHWIFIDSPCTGHAPMDISLY